MRNFICRKSVAVIKATKHLTNHTSDNGYTRKYLTKSVFAVASSKNFFYRRMSVLLGNSKLKCTRQNSTVCISLVLNNFIQKRLATKSRELNCDWCTGNTSKPYNNIGMHLHVRPIRWRTTSSVAIRSTLPKILFLLRPVYIALSKEYLSRIQIILVV